MRRIFSQRPGRLVPLAYLVGWLTGTALLLLPAATTPGNHTGWWQASFTAMSALCITGLAVVDTATHWSPLGQVVILALVQLGGFGIMTLTSMLLFHVVRRVDHRTARLAQTETRSTITGIENIPRRILTMTMAAEGAIMVLLTGRFLCLGYELPSALWRGFFHAVSAFNNAGFALYSDNLVSFNADPFVILPICVAIVAGGLGFPVYLELLERHRGHTSRRVPSVHLRLTVLGTLALLVAGYLTFVVFEWNNPGTLGGQSWSGKALGALGGSVFPRTAGFNSIDYAQASQPTLAINFGLMLIGGGSAGTAGGIKVTTVAVLLLAVSTEIAGEAKTVFGGRKISSALTRQALAVTTLATAVVFTAILVLASLENQPLHALTFEVISAFGTVGLSMNLTPLLRPGSWAVLMVLMFLGRVGPVTVATALALHSRPRRYEVPQEDPLVG
ncbi:potassium uptake TrkH family protein [Luteococcus japonicus]|uniref:Potassium uptake TrkH family protein n=1 Tax=Luteococcus japonicus TaxID=33984 RepID=A0A3N1ZWX1_9ACTN|nr:potassium transporter TrkG [Luteococcus japonicus]ROR55316.1 potassium uptake TrkH family protein [Luteococcus japonicus]